MLIQNHIVRVKSCGMSMLLVAHEPDSTSSVNVLQRLFVNTFSGSREWVM